MKQTRLTSVQAAILLQRWWRTILVRLFQFFKILFFLICHFSLNFYLIVFAFVCVLPGSTSIDA